MSVSVTPSKHERSARPAAGEDLLAELGRRLNGRISTTPPDRLAYARDLWPRGLLGVAAGDPAPHPPDAVAWPTSTAEVAQVVELLAARRVPIVPFGAGSGVCGGALPLNGGVVVDMKRMRRLLALDERAGTATFEAGIVGEHLEHELNRRGYTLGHFPSSIMCSTLGGWLAARSAGQLSTKYGKIEDMVRRLVFVDGTGRVHELEAGEGGPELLQIIVGSEGTLGLITEATLTIHPLAEARLYGGWSFPRVSAGLEAIRRLLQRGLRPACVRLYDELDTLVHRLSRKRPDDRGAEPETEGGALDGWLGALGVGDLGHKLGRAAIAAALHRPALVNRLGAALGPYAGGCRLVLGFEGERRTTEAEAAAAREIFLGAGGKDLGPGPGEHWLRHRYDVSFRMSKIFDAGAFVDTMEVATSWDRLVPLYQTVRAALSPLGYVMAHFSHAYEDGCSIYFTFASRGHNRLEAERRYDDLWRAGLAATLQVGATISHHHGVGLSKAPFMPAEHGEGMALYRAWKDVLDPHDIMNPGKMGL